MPYLEVMWLAFFLMNACSNTLLSFFTVNNTQAIRVGNWVQTPNTLPISLCTSSVPNGHLKKCNQKRLKMKLFRCQISL